MIIDVTGIELTPGMRGEHCQGNGMYNKFICCCDECNYQMCCLDPAPEDKCLECFDEECPRSRLNVEEMF